MIDCERSKAIEKADKECKLLGEVCMSVISDLKSNSSVWDDFINKAGKLHSQLKNTLSVLTSFLDAFQRVADIANNARGGTREIGNTLTRICLRQKAVESKLRVLNTSFEESLLSHLSREIEEWKRNVFNLDKEHSKSVREFKRHRSDLRKKTANSMKLQKKCLRRENSLPKNRDIQRRVNEAYEELSAYYNVTGEKEKQALRSALIEERSQFCTFSSYIRPFLEIQSSMSTEFTQMEELLSLLMKQTKEPNCLPEASELLISDIGGFNNNFFKDVNSTTYNRSSMSSPKSLLSSSSSSAASWIDVRGSSVSSDNSYRCSTIQPSRIPVSSSKYSISKQNLRRNQKPSYASSQLSRDSGFTSQEQFYTYSSSSAAINESDKDCNLTDGNDVHFACGTINGNITNNSTLIASPSSPIRQNKTVAGDMLRTRPQLSAQLFDPPDPAMFEKPCWKLSEDLKNSNAFDATYSSSSSNGSSIGRRRSILSSSSSIYSSRSRSHDYSRSRASSKVRPVDAPCVPVPTREPGWSKDHMLPPPPAVFFDSTPCTKVPCKPKSNGSDTHLNGGDCSAYYGTVEQTIDDMYEYLTKISECSHNHANQQLRRIKPNPPVRKMVDDSTAEFPAPPSPTHIYHLPPPPIELLSDKESHNNFLAEIQRGIKLRRALQ